MTPDEVLASYDRAVDVGTAAATCPVAFYCRLCNEPQYVGPPDDLCVDCGGFDWAEELQRSRAT